MSGASTDRMWQAVASRDHRADGAFVYAVRSTRIYCRPSCPSRRPGRARVSFYPTPAAASAAGYRACRRCRPDAVADSEPAAERLARMCRAVAAAADARWTTERLARQGGCSPSQVRRLFRETLALTPRGYVAAVRRRTFLKDVRGGTPVTDAIYNAGYGSTSRVYEGNVLPAMTPASYGRGGEGARIDWLAVRSPIGMILVAATSRGLCSVEIGESRQTLLAALRTEFPRASIAPRQSAALAPWAEVVRAVVDAKPIRGSVPVDIRATAFQWRIWRALTRVPAGETRSYGDLAASIGRPSAARAVARACASNPLALVVPCHRVIGSDDQLRGYRWGIEVKRKLLDRESQARVRR